MSPSVRFSWSTPLMYIIITNVTLRFRSSTFVCHSVTDMWGFPDGSVGKESACQCRRHKRHGFNPWVRMIPWRRKWQPTPVLLPGKFHGQRSLAGYSPRGHKELDGIDHTHAHTSRINRFTKYGFGNIQATTNAYNSCHLGAGTAPIR